MESTRSRYRNDDLAMQMRRVACRLIRDLPIDVDDVLQTVHMEAIGAEPPWSIDRYLQRTGYHAVCAKNDYFRAATQRWDVELSSPTFLDTFVGPTLGEQYGIEDPRRQQAARELLPELLNCVPPRDRACLELRYLQGHSQQQASRILGVSEDTVRTSCTRAMRRIRQYITTPAGRTWFSRYRQRLASLHSVDRLEEGEPEGDL